MTRNHAPISTSIDEGVIKFDLAFNHAPPQELEAITELNAWRHILYRLGLTGCDPARYQGLAYGNVSMRTGPSSFIISGTQTGAKPHLSLGDYCLVLGFDLAKNQVWAQGPIEPSSEALTHGAVYSVNPDTNCVLHVHSPLLWRSATQLGIAQTDASIAYGTPEMGLAVGLAAEGRSQGIISMGGHEDGLIAFADTICIAAIELVKCLAEAEKLSLVGWAKAARPCPSNRADLDGQDPRGPLHCH